METIKVVQDIVQRHNDGRRHLGSSGENYLLYDPNIFYRRLRTPVVGRYGVGQGLQDTIV